MISFWWEGIPGLDPARWPPNRKFADAVAATACAMHIHQIDPSPPGTPGRTRIKITQTAKVLNRWFAEPEDDWDGYVRRQAMAFVLGLPGIGTDTQVLKTRAKWFCDNIAELTRIGDNREWKKH
jgi:hypothetical protein